MTPAQKTDRVFNEIGPWLLKNGLKEPFGIARLAGDGSTRSFFRVISKTKSYVLLCDKKFTFSADYPPIQKYLVTKKLPVPKFVAQEKKEGLLLMEDLGDDLLQQKIQTPSEMDKILWLRKGVSLLAELHGKCFPVPKTLPVSKRSFDKKKYFQELQFTLEHLHRGLLKLTPGKNEKVVSDFCKTIASFRPLVFSHRDYHSRNILVRLDKLFLIDFQDARLGSPHYDLASYLFDPYVPVTDIERDDLTNIYKTKLKKFPKLYKAIFWETFEADLKLVAFQRLVKAAGSFASFFTRFGKKTHFPYLIPALESAKQLAIDDSGNLGPLAEFFQLETCLEKCRAL